MSKTKASSLGIAIVAAIGFFGTFPPAHAAIPQNQAISGRCEYSTRVTRYREEATLILCDTAMIEEKDASVTIGFGQRSWGTMAGFTGIWAGDKMIITELALRGARSATASGTCQVIYRNEGKLSAISCLARMGSRWVAANFVPSSL